MDEINANLFKPTFPAIINEMVHLVNICLQCGVFPDAFKFVIVKPIYKTGERHHLAIIAPLVYYHAFLRYQKKIFTPESWHMCLMPMF